MTRFAIPEGGHFSGWEGKGPEDGLFADCEHHFEVRLFGFAGGDFGASHVEARSRKQATDGARGEAGVALAVARGHLVLLMLIEAKQDQAPPRAQHARALRK